MTGIMHKFSTAAAKPSGVLHRQRSATRLRVTRLVRAAFSPLRDENLSMIPVNDRFAQKKC